MSTKQRELLASQLNANEPNNFPSGQIVEREQIENTPFWIVGNKERGYFLAFGKFQMTEEVPNKLDVILNLEKDRWNVLVKMIVCVTEMEWFKAIVTNNEHARNNIDEEIETGHRI